MFEVLEQVPGYSNKTTTHITRQAYDEATTSFTGHLKKAFELFNGYWRTSNALLLDMSLEELLKARNFMDVIMYAVADDKVINKMSKRATFMYDLAATMMGGKV